MRKRSKLLLLLSTVLLVGAFCWVLSRDKEPSYAGRTLSSWVAEYSQLKDPTGSEAARAIQHIGSNALPHLLREISYTQPMWKRTMLSASRRLTARFPGTFQVLPWTLRYDGREIRATIAVEGFKALGPTAEPAVPRLTELALDRDPAHIRASKRAVEALFSMRPLPKTALGRLLAEGPDSLRIETFGYIESVYETSLVRDLLPSVTKSLHEGQGVVPMLAAGLIASLRTSDPEGTLAILMNAVGSPRPEVRRRVLESIYAFGTNAAPAAAFVGQFLTDPDPSVREATSNLFRKIAPESLRQP